MQILPVIMSHHIASFLDISDFVHISEYGLDTEAYIHEGRNMFSDTCALDNKMMTKQMLRFLFRLVSISDEPL